MRLSLLVVVAVALLAGAARAQDAKKIVLGPFGGKGTSGAALRDAVELELVVREDLLLVDADQLLRQVGEDLGEASPSRIGKALDALDQDGLLRGEARGRGVVVVLLHRAGDGAIVYARRVEVDKAKADLEGRLLDDLVPALVRVRKLQPLTPSELASVDVEEDVLTGGGGPAKGVIHDPTREERPVVDDEPEDAPPPPRREERPRLDEEERPRPRPRDETPRLKDVDEKEPRAPLFRASGSLAPVWFNYRACPVLDRKLPFTCRARESVPPTEVSAGFLPDLGGAFAFEVAPLPYLAIAADGALFFTPVTARFPAGSRVGLLVEGQDASVFNVLGGTGALGLVARWSGKLAANRASFGGHLGYRALFLLAQENTIVVDGIEERSFNLLPSFSTHALAAGIRGVATFADRATIALELDALPGVHLEGPTRVGDKDLMFGAGFHAKASLDVDVALGLSVVLHAGVDAMNAGAEGTGTRLTRALQPFTNAQVDYWQATVGVGVAYRY